MAKKGYYNTQGTLTLCEDCKNDSSYASDKWVNFPKHFDNDNCTDCGSEIGAYSDNQAANRALSNTIQAPIDRSGDESRRPGY